MKHVTDTVIPVYVKLLDEYVAGALHSGVLDNVLNPTFANVELSPPEQHIACIYTLYPEFGRKLSILTTVSLVVTVVNPVTLGILYDMLYPHTPSTLFQVKVAVV